MSKNKPSDAVLSFMQPIYIGEARKTTPAWICFLNIGAAIIMLSEQKSTITFSLVVAGMLLAILGLFIVNSGDGWTLKAIYGFSESTFLLVLAYLVAYMEYRDAGYLLNSYVLYTQLVGGGILITFLLIFIYRLKKPARGLNESEMERSITVGLVIGLGIIVVIFGGLILLYFTVFKRNMHLIESSKMLYVAMGLNVLVAYYLLKMICCIKYHAEIKEVCNGKSKKKRKG